MINLYEMMYWLKRRLCSFPILDDHEYMVEISRKIENGVPFLAGKIGGNELWALRVAEFGYWDRLDLLWKHMTEEAGFFYDGDKKEGIERFADIMKESIAEIDYTVEWQKPKEYYFFKKYRGGMPELMQWLFVNPQIINGRKVLVVHPFKKSIEYQYGRKELLFKHSGYLPEMELTVMKSVQTIGGIPDPRFRNWFAALDHMTDEALDHEFDVAIIGCGAYGLPLAARLKKAGRRAIHLGGDVQLMFGIMGKRWENNSWVESMMTDAWIHPLPEDIPKNYKKVEDGCYW